MKSIIKIFGVIKSKLTLKLIWFIGLFILTSFTLWKVYSFFSFDNEVEQTSVSNISMANSLGELKTFLKLNKEDNLFTVGLPPIINVLFVNTKDKTLLYQPNTSENNVTIEYESVNSLIKKVKAGSEEIFDDLINTYFQIPNYSQFLSKKNNIPFIEIIQIGESIGADTGYLKQISDKGGNDIRTILLSLIYNTIYSGSNGHMATVIENQKLKSLNNKNYKIDIVNSKLLSESLTRLQSDSKNDRKKFIESEYRQYHPSDLTIEPDVSDNELQVNIEKLLQSKSIRLDASAPFDFLYINFRKDILYCGERAYPYNSSTLYAVDESNLDYLFTKQFAIPNYKSLATKEIVLQIGIPADTAKFPETNNDSQTSFIALLNYLLNNPSVYCINNGKLQSFQSIKNDSMLYGKFNRSMLQKAIDDLSQYNTNDSEYSIVKIDNVTPRVIYTTIFLLFLSYCILFFFYFVRQTSKEDIILELKGYFNEKLKSIKEEYEKLIVNSRKVTQEKTMIEITQYLTRPGLYLDYETPTLKAVRHKVIFYSEIEKSKNSANLIKILNIERTNNQNIPKVESANDIFDEVNKEKSRVDKITHLLDKFDEYSSNVSKEKEKLIEKFQEYKKAKNSMDNLNTLLKEEFKGDFFSHLKDHIIKIENNPSIKNFVRFGLLFKSSNHI